jgi:hypothetical protein
MAQFLSKAAKEKVDLPSCLSLPFEILDSQVMAVLGNFCCLQTGFIFVFCSIFKLFLEEGLFDKS